MSDIWIAESLDDLWAAYEKAAMEGSDLWMQEFRRRIEAKVGAERAAGDAPLDGGALNAALERWIDVTGIGQWAHFADDDVGLLAELYAAEYARLASGAADTEGAEG